jgi:hypothetical protein
MNELETVEVYRRRWRRARSRLRLIDTEADDFGTGGLGRFVEDVGVRLLILPADPEANVVEFDNDFWTWWLEDRPNAFEATSRTNWGPRHCPTSDAAVRFDRWTDDRWKWEQYLALHRSGALEFALGRIGVHEWLTRQDEVRVRGFHLVPIVGRTWNALALYGRVINEMQVRGPWEASLALTRTSGALLGTVALGWRDFQDWHFESEIPICGEPNVFLRREIEEWPDEDGIQTLAFLFGAMVDDAWGTKSRRFLVHESREGTGEFDATRYN